MSHTTEEYICPNCGFHTSHNYCAQCGQEVHLHKDTLWALTTHFIGHYIHYDSKFWQTLKTLIVSPGKLTTAYWNKQRARYLSPISLYLFISFIFFLVFYTVLGHNIEETREITTKKAELYKSADTTKVTELTVAQDKTTGHMSMNGQTSALSEDRKKAFNNTYQLLPKLFFFMVPLMAFVLKALFFRRKEYSIVHHTIFSVHIQSFYFLTLLVTFNQFEGWLMDILGTAILVVPVVYTSIAIRNVYNTNWLKAVVYNIVIIVTYGIILAALAIGYFALYNKLHHLGLLH
jgi:hypothetical protein